MPFNDEYEKYAHVRAARIALVSLKNAYPEEYERVYRSERERIEAEVREHGHPIHGHVGPKRKSEPKPRLSRAKPRSEWKARTPRPARKRTARPVTKAAASTPATRAMRRVSVAIDDEGTSTRDMATATVARVRVADESVEGTVTATAIATRICASDGCTTPLSRYNPGVFCGPCESHQRSVVPEPRVEPEPVPEKVREPASRMPKETKARKSVARTKRMSDGTVLDSMIVREPSTRDDKGRVICRGCTEYISPKFLGCGCDPGFLDDNAVPLDPRYRSMGPIDDAVDVQVAV